MSEWEKKKKEMDCLREKFGDTMEKQPTTRDCGGNTNALLENRYF